MGATCSSILEVELPRLPLGEDGEVEGSLVISLLSLKENLIVEIVKLTLSCILLGKELPPTSN